MPPDDSPTGVDDGYPDPVLDAEESSSYEGDPDFGLEDTGDGEEMASDSPLSVATPEETTTFLERSGERTLRVVCDLARIPVEGGDDFDADDLEDAREEFEATFGVDLDDFSPAELTELAETIAAELGWTVEDADDPLAPRDPRVDGLLAERDARREAERAAAESRWEKEQLEPLEAAFEEDIRDIARREGRTLSDEEIDQVFDVLLALPPVPTKHEHAIGGLHADIHGAWNEFRRRERAAAVPAPVSAREQRVDSMTVAAQRAMDTLHDRQVGETGDEDYDLEPGDTAARAARRALRAAGVRRPR